MSVPSSYIQVDRKRQQKARAYARTRRWLLLVELVLGMLYLLAWLLSDTALTLRDRLEAFVASPWLVVAGFALVLGGLYLLLASPLSYYSGFILPHRYGLSRQTLAGWIEDQIKGVALGGGLGLLLLEGMYALLRLAPDRWWIWAGLGYLGVVVVLANLLPTVIAPLFFKFEPLTEAVNDRAQRVRYVALAERLRRLYAHAGTKVRGVYRFDMSRRTTAANAAVIGLGNTRRIILADTLLDNFSDDEIETVMAHELGHHIHRDLLKGVLVQSVLTMGELWLADLALRWGVGAFGFQNLADVAALPWLVLVLGVFGLVTMPLSNAWSRWRERMADQYALEATRKPDAFASAMARLANQNLAEAEPARWVMWLLYDHPPIGERLQRAESFRSSELF